MQTLSDPVPSAKARWRQVAAAGSFAAVSVWLAVHQLTSAGKDLQIQGKVPVLEAKMAALRNRTPAPEFWLSNHAAGREQAQATGKPIFLVIRCEP